MTCPKCQNDKNYVKVTETLPDNSIQRVRRCRKCDTLWSTTERIDVSIKDKGPQIDEKTT